MKFCKATNLVAAYDIVPAAFDFLTFLSLFDCLPDLSPCNSYFFLVILVVFGGLAIKALRQDIVRRLSLCIDFRGAKLLAFSRFSHFPSLSLIFSLAKHPLRMIT